MGIDYNNIYLPPSHIKPVGSGSFHDVYLFDSNKGLYLPPEKKCTSNGLYVVKIPGRLCKITHQTKEDMLRSLDIHSQYLGKYMLDTNILDHPTQNDGYLQMQPYLEGSHLTSSVLRVNEYVYDQFRELVSLGLKMQKKRRTLFGCIWSPCTPYFETIWINIKYLS